MKMKISGRNIRKTWSRIWRQLRVSGATCKCDSVDLPLSSELFNFEQMTQHGKRLAETHRLTTKRLPDRLLARLAENECILLEAHHLLSEDVKSDGRITPAGEWLLDNFYVIEEQIRTAGHHLPKGYSQELPRLANSSSAGSPRVYELALETISHADGRVDPETLCNFIAAYQAVTPLKLGELWAIPIMLRLGLIENLRRVVVRIVSGRSARNSAIYWVGKMTEMAVRKPENLILVIADMARSNPLLTSSFVAELTRGLHGQGPALALPLTWMEQRLAETNQTIEQLVRLENQLQASNQVAMSNSIGSLRVLDTMDWSEFVEQMSVVEQTLINDPANIYTRMDFATRDSYRHIVETAAKNSPHSEAEIARQAIRLARENHVWEKNDARTKHVGFYLIDKGLAQLEKSMKVRLSLTDLIRKFCNRFPLTIYVGGGLLLTVALTIGLVSQAYAGGAQGWLLGLLTLLSVLAASHLAMALMNHLITLSVMPQRLPRMDFSKGIPPEQRTLAVIPTIIGSIKNIDNLAKALEIHFLANRDSSLHFGLLTDFGDADQETLPEDDFLLKSVQQQIEQLNDKYRNEASDTFFLFHRPRRWNAQDQIWMGYERKRGKLSDLNKLLRGRAGNSFSLIVGNQKVLSNVKYVITLDTDTRTSRDSARQFVAAMAHPLNRAYYDETCQRVTAGYGILQPRVASSLSGTDRSRYARMCANELGIDPYTRAVSDVYQDLFGEGSFIGKGIYEVNVFEQALAGRLPDNRILSHDLLEGCYIRSGLLADVQLYEEDPSSYNADVNRRRRWIRGDWQIAHWLLPRVPGPNGKRIKNPLSMLSRWKIFDNLRRSLTAAVLTALLLLSWILLPSTWLWTLAVVGIVMIPSLLVSFINVIQKADNVTFGQHLSAAIRLTVRHIAQAAFTLVCLPYEAFYSLDAIARAVWRLLISHKLLLQWNPSENSARHHRSGVIAAYRTMWISPVIALAVAGFLIARQSAALPAAGVILALWFAAPSIIGYISLPLQRRHERLTAAQLVFLRKIARKTWAFFESFVGPDDHWLPPDNYQEHPVAVIAHRTSPTNMGLALLANLSAYDFGTISAGQLIDRTTKSLQTMTTLERYQGHFFNWYDTLSLEPLPPLYISSVDSGNLAGHLLTLVPGLLGLPDRKILEHRLFDGLNDTLGVLADAASAESYASDRLVQLKHDLAAAIQTPSVTLTTLWSCLDHLGKSAAAIVEDTETFTSDPNSQLSWWVNAFERQCRDARDELTLLTPWISLLTPHDSLLDFPALNKIPTLKELAVMEEKLLPEIVPHLSQINIPEGHVWLEELHRLISAAGRLAQNRIEIIHKLARQCENLAQMNYDFLYDKSRKQLAIGYNVSERRCDASYYDLLASEARLACFVAIAQGQLPQESWFGLGRQLTTAGGEPVLLSWSGSMFEYLMPLLVMPTYKHTLLYQTCGTVVSRQIEYGRRNGIPWGVSESGYNAIDVHLNYQYRAFGVPGLGLKRGLAGDMVIAPYASVLALMVAPAEACLNLERLSANGFETRYGFYEAIDYTPSRLQARQTFAVIRSFMAHHQGMSLLALANLLLERPMQKYFEANPLFQATMLLLQERIPNATSFYAHTTELAEYRLDSCAAETQIRVFNSPDTPKPEVQLLSNGRYHVMISNAGGGYSRWNDIAVTRWREDGTCDNWGSFCYIRDVAAHKLWSAAYQPTRQSSKHYEAIFSEGRAEFRRRDLDYETYTEIVVSPEDDIELRRVRITNLARVRRTIEVTSYAEVVLAPAAADALHPAFSNLFVQTEIIRRLQTIFCTRRPRSSDESAPCMLHQIAVHGARLEKVSYETDREKFLGRGNSVATPQVMNGVPKALSDNEGSVLDPIVAIRCLITLEPEEAVTLNIVSGVGETRDDALNLVEKYQDRRLADRVFDLAWTHSQVLLRQLNISEAEAQLYARLAGSVIYANASLRADARTLIKNRRGQSGLWGYTISGDFPIVLLKIEDPANIDLVRQMVQAHAYWRLKGLAVDLVIWNEDHSGYRQLLHDRIMALIAAGIDANVTDRPGGIFVRAADQIAEEDRVLIETASRIIISDGRGTLEEQINGQLASVVNVPLLVPTRFGDIATAAVAPLPRNDLAFYNGLGGFTPDGREYVITTTRKQLTPMPWVNVIANPDFGTVISESGSTYTWSENAHEFRLTPWNNDPVSDSTGEAFYLRDEERGNFWSPTPQPCRGATPYLTRHGFGYSVFEHTEFGIRSELWIYVALDAPVKFAVLKIRNDSGRSRRLSATGYVEWVLGDLRSKSNMHVISEVDPVSNALFASNPYNTEFQDRTAFFDVDDPKRTVSGDRVEFLGRNGTLNAPAAMTRTRLSGKTGTALDSCAAIQVAFDLGEGQEHEIVFRLGVGRNAGDARNLVHRFRGSQAAQHALDAAWQHWTHTLGAINVETPDQALNVLVNGWLLYQTLACRMWARSAVYQSGGAFGFRDQLQDTLALIHARPLLVREHLLLAASRQFLEGDVQHWWHPPMGRGVRTHCSDDYLWLPFVTCRYVNASGDTGVLDESVNFLYDRPVKTNEDSYYDLPGQTTEIATLYEHCVRAIKYGLKFGKHGLPLMGGGDWNDGMNLVGEQGQGESVWLGFFLYEVLTRFAAVARLHDDEAFAVQCIAAATELQLNLEAHGWDGQWYRRAYFDDGSPLGSSLNSECRIDSIAQSWSVLSGAGDHRRSHMAMTSLSNHLVRRESGLVQLLDPPFDQSGMNPGYIKGYVPGVRENGGQYTHAAVWASMAFARLGDKRQAWEVFNLINPVNHGDSTEKVDVYKAEPYVMAADVYAAAPHTGRGGWTWYTGSAAWMYQLIVESLLGIKLEVDKLKFTPCLPAEWSEFKIHYRYRETVYHLVIRQITDNNEMRVSVDGIEQPDHTIPLVDDHNEHWGEVNIPST